MKKLLTVSLAAFLPLLAYGQSATDIVKANPKIIGTTEKVEIMTQANKAIELKVNVDGTPVGWTIAPTTGNLTSVGGAGLTTGTVGMSTPGDVVLTAQDKQIQVLSGVAAVDADVIVAAPDTSTVGYLGANTTAGQLAFIANIADAVGFDLTFLKTRAAADAWNANSIISSGDDIATITAYGANGATFDPAAQILMESGGTPGASADMPGQIRFLVTPDGSATLAEALKIGPTKLVTAANGVTVTAGDVIVTAGDLSLVATGKTIEYETGTAASACMGDSTFNGTTAVTVSTTCATTGSRIFLSNTGDGSGTSTNDQSGCWATNIQNGTSFDADCSDAANNATFNWVIFHEAP